MAYLAIDSKIKKRENCFFRRKIDSDFDLVVKSGQKITKDQVIAYGRKSDIIDVINVKKELGSKTRKVDKYVKVFEGEIIHKGDVLAVKKSRFGISKNVVLSKEEGRIDLSSIKSGKIKIRSIVKEKVLEAKVSGFVGKIIPGKYIEIKTDFIEIQPVMILGGKVQGNFYFLSKELVQSNYNILDPGLRGTIIGTDFYVNVKFVRQLKKSGVKGLVVNSIKFEELEKIKKDEQVNGFTIVILEGFGELPLKEHIHELLNTNDGEYVSILKKEFIVIFSVTGENVNKVNLKSVAVKRLKEGVKVQVFDVANWGENGLVTSINGDVCFVKNPLKKQKKFLVRDLLIY